jgi:hypothetical protein
MTPMRESPYVSDYLKANADRGPGKGITVGCYLIQLPRGRAQEYYLPYWRVLRSALERRVEAGEVVRLPSARGGTAYHSVGDLPWPLIFRLKLWLQAQQEVTVPLEIDCRHHLRRHEIGAVSGKEVLDIWTINKALRETLGKRTVTLTRPQGPGDPAVPVLASLLLDAARALAAQPDQPIKSGRLSGVLCNLGLAAALLHARTCSEAEVIIRVVEAEITATGRVAHALRSAADPGWVAARALETI